MVKVARALIPHTDGITPNALASKSVGFSADTALTALATLNDLEPAQKSPGFSNFYLIGADALPIVAQAVLAMEDDSVVQRAATWNIDARGRIERIEGMYQMM